MPSISLILCKITERELIMSKIATIILSSPRKGSNSSALALAMGEGVTKAGGKVEVVDLSKLDIKPCQACMACQGNGGKCLQEDGMQGVYPTVVASSILILASPIYWFNMCGQIKTFIDRCFAVASIEAGPFSRKTIALTLAYGGGDTWDSGAVNAIHCVQDICRYTGAAWGGCVYGSAMAPYAFIGNVELLEKARQIGTKMIPAKSEKNKIIHGS